MVKIKHLLRKYSLKVSHQESKNEENVYSVFAIAEFSKWVES